MISLELINHYVSALGNFTELTKTEIKEIANLLSEFKAIEKKIVLIREKLKQSTGTKVKDKYIELDGKIFDLATLEEFEVIPVDEVKLTQLANIKKEIDKGFESFEQLVNAQEKHLDELMESREELINNLFFDAENKAVKSDSLLILQEKQGYSKIISTDQLLNQKGD